MSTIHPTALVATGAELGEDVEIGPYCVIGPNVAIGDRTRIMAHAVIDGNTTLGADCVIFPFASIGTQTQDLKYRGATTYVRIGDRTVIREYVTVNSATEEGETTAVGSGCFIMAYAHVAHACRVGDEVIMANSCGLAGHVVVEDQAVLGGLCGVHQFVRIGRLCMVGGLTKVVQDCPPFMLVDGNPASVKAVNTVGLTRRGYGEDVIRALKRAYSILYRQGLSTVQAVEKIDLELRGCSAVEHLTSFIKSSSRGIIK